MLDPGKARSSCIGTLGGGLSVSVADSGSTRAHHTFGGQPFCEWPAGVALAIYYAAAEHDLRTIERAARRLALLAGAPHADPGVAARDRFASVTTETRSDAQARRYGRICRAGRLRGRLDLRRGDLLWRTTVPSLDLDGLDENAYFSSRGSRAPTTTSRARA